MGYKLYSLKAFQVNNTTENILIWYPILWFLSFCHPLLQSTSSFGVKNVRRLLPNFPHRDLERLTFRPIHAKSETTGPALGSLDVLNSIWYSVFVPKASYSGQVSTLAGEIILDYLTEIYLLWANWIEAVSSVFLWGSWLTPCWLWLSDIPLIEGMRKQKDIGRQTSNEQTEGEAYPKQKESY